MSQKANLITIRRSPKINLIAHNSKIWVSLFRLLESLDRLFFLKGVVLCKSFLGLDNNLVKINLFLYYKNFKISFYKIKFFSLKAISSFNLESKKRGLLFLLTNYINSYNYNNYVLRFVNLNTLLNKKDLSFLFNKLKNSIKGIFLRRFNLFIDFLKLTVLYLNNYIDLGCYVKIWSSIFKFLSKRVHTRFILFVKNVFIYVLNLCSLFDKQSSILGIKFIISGRLQGKERSSSKLIKIGKVPTQSIRKDIDFAFYPSYTLYGAFGLKFWVYRGSI